MPSFNKNREKPIKIMTDIHHTEKTTKGGKKPTKKSPKKPEKTVIEESESEEIPTTEPSNGPDIISDSSSSTEDEAPEVSKVSKAPKVPELHSDSDSEDEPPAPAEVEREEKVVYRRRGGRPIRQSVKKPVTYNETALQRSNQGLPPVKKATGKKSTTEKKPHTTEKNKTKKPKEITKKNKRGRVEKTKANTKVKVA